MRTLVSPSYDVHPMRPAGASTQPSLLGRLRAYLRRLLLGETTEILDLSHWNGDIDWGLLSVSEVKAVILRATYGINGVDNKFDSHVFQARTRGLGVMTYHYQLSQYGGAVQAAHHWTTIQSAIQSLGYVPVVWDDVEDINPGVTNSQRLNRTHAFLEYIDAHSARVNKAVGMYTSPGYANTYLSPAPVWINDYLQWIAHWTSASMPTVPTGWLPVPHVWQYGIWNNHWWCDPVMGGTPDIDRNRFFGTYKQLKSMVAGV